MIIGDESGLGIKTFAKEYLSCYFQELKQAISDELRAEQEETVRGTSEDDYVDYLVGAHLLDELKLFFDDKAIEEREEWIPSGKLGLLYAVDDPDREVRVTVIRYYIPYTGDPELLKWRPNTFYNNFEEVIVEDDMIAFDILSVPQDPQALKTQAQQVINHIASNYHHMVEDVKQHNQSLRNFILQEVRNRKQSLSQKKEFMNALDAPIRASETVSKTYSVPPPKVRQKIVIKKPKANSDGLIPEPSLNVTDYNRILEIIRDGGQALEQHPSTYEGKGEEQLRDTLLVALRPNIEASATGEAFNKKGKTDILIKHEGKNVFVAECKFWTGEKSFLGAINQLLGYLTWRDSKAALVVFVGNKGFTRVLDKVKEVIPTHPNYLSTKKHSNETHLNYRIHLDGDENREVWLAILLFHVPPVKKPV